MKFNNTKKTVAERTKTTNFEGGEAFNPDSPEMALYKVTINNLLEDTYYREDEEELDALAKRFDACAEENPEFILKLAVHARNEMGLRDVSQVLLAMAAEDDRTKSFVDQYAEHIMVRADEPCTVVAIYDQLFEGSLPKPLRRGIEDALHNFDKYQYDKYDNTNREVNIRDVINRVHPEPRDELREEIFEKLMKGDLDKYPEIEPLNEAQDSTWESVISEKGNNAEAWREVLPRMGIMAKLRNVRNMKQAGLESEEIFKNEDLERVRNSRMFPFRIYQSYKAVKNARVSDPHIDEWMSEAIDTTTENLPDKLQNTLSVADTSGSMSSTVSNQSNLECLEISALFTAAVGRKGADMAGFASGFEAVTAHSQTPTLELQNKVQNAGEGHGTNAELIMQALIQEEAAYERVIIWSDMQLWSRFGNDTFKQKWHEYKEKVAPEASLYLVDLQSYGDLAMPEGEDDVYQISGWTEKVIDFIQYAENEDQIIQEIEEIER